jgi:hypothetical protein
MCTRGSEFFSPISIKQFEKSVKQRTGIIALREQYSRALLVVTVMARLRIALQYLPTQTRNETNPRRGAERCNPKLGLNPV